MFVTVSIAVVGPFGKLPPPEFKLLAMLCRYSNAGGEACPTLEQLAADADTSKPTVSRVMAELEKRKAITRHRAGNGRYFYVIAKEFRPRWPSQIAVATGDVQEMEHEIIAQPGVPDPEHAVAAASGRPADVQEPEHRVSQRETQQVSLISKLKNARARELRTVRSDERDKRRAQDWVRNEFWLRDGTWGPRPDQPGCTLPPDLLAWCLAERAKQRSEKRSALVARVASAHSGRQESMHARREGAAWTGAGLPTKEQLHVLRGGI